MSGFKDHFSGVASGYARFRPVYPAALFGWLAEAAPGREAAWDCATGSGQAAVGVAEHFARVVGTDASAEQVAHAQPHPRVEYRVAPAEASGLPDGSADLVTVAQALHWFDVPAFFREARRVLRPGGLVAVWTYGNPVLADPGPGALLDAFTEETIGPFWPPERRLILDGYASLDFPFAEVAPPPFPLEADLTLDALLGLLRTWSAVPGYVRAHGHDPVDAFADALRDPWGDPATPRRVRWPLAMRAGYDS